jgi:hypothetical protein
MHRRSRGVILRARDLHGAYGLRRLAAAALVVLGALTVMVGVVVYRLGRAGACQEPLLLHLPHGQSGPGPGQPIELRSGYALAAVIKTDIYADMSHPKIIINDMINNENIGVTKRTQKRT